MVYKYRKIIIKTVKIAVRRCVGILMHSMLMATMMMVAQMMSGMEFNCHHKEKLGISGMEFQLKVDL